MRGILHCASALNACDRALKCLFNLRGINDPNDRVRLAAFELLNELIGHRYIKIVKLLLPSYIKESLSPDEVINRILVMGAQCEAAAWSFHRIIITENLISVERAVEGRDGGSAEVDETICSEFSMCETFIEPNQDDKSEKSEIWRSSLVLLNCLAVMWLPLRIKLEDKKYAKENEQLRRLLNKLFKLAFLRYRNTSAIEAIMQLGKTLDFWEQAKIMVLQELFHSCSLENEDRARMYLETAASWDFNALLKFVDECT
ncbi:unnamed protein product [Gongylonema pulchrum]|uniref:RICTOR_V domain-containing protein n=1 Tax=Gongylonema pulchrum TaxID=637853 RepID=A0A183E3Z2_9BILA|nr:unnamed protein product [Gongylonema pulchrum]